MKRYTTVTAATLAALVLTAAACGADDTAPTTTQPTEVTAPPVTTAAPTTTSAPTTTAAAAAPSTTAVAPPGATFVAGSAEEAAATAYRAVFDSTQPFDAKAAHLEDAAALQATIEQYRAAAGRFGGFSLVPTAVTIDGTTAMVTYDVYFGSAAQYRGQSGTVSLVGDTWVVPRAEFCGFVSSARVPCPA